MQNNISNEATNIDLVKSSGTLYRYDTDKSLHPMKIGIGCPNTLAWSTDNS